MKEPGARRIKWFHIVLITIVALLLLSLSPIYPARVGSAADNRTLVAITLDDGYHCWTSEIMPVLQKYDMPATFYIIDPQYQKGFSWTDAQELYNAGYEIGWHTAKHVSVDMMASSEIASDFESAEPMFESHGLPRPETFAYPSGRHSDQSMEVASRYFVASRTTEDGVNYPDDVRENPQHLRGYSMEKGLSFLEKKVNKYSGQNVLITLVGHTVGEVASWQTKPDMTVDDFNALAEFLHEKEQAGLIEVVTLDEGVKRLQQQELSYTWRIRIDSPFDTWFRFWVIPVPERYYIFYEKVVLDFIGHRYPQVPRWFDRY